MAILLAILIHVLNSELILSKHWWHTGAYIDALLLVILVIGLHGESGIINLL